MNTLVFEKYLSFIFSVTSVKSYCCIQNNSYLVMNEQLTVKQESICL